MAKRFRLRACPLLRAALARRDGARPACRPAIARRRQGRRHLGDRRRSARQAAHRGRARAAHRHRRAGQRSRSRPAPTTAPTSCSSTAPRSPSGPNAQLTIDKFVYDPATKTGDLAINASKGVFRLVGGKISKTNADHRHHAVEHDRHPRRHHHLQRQTDADDVDLRLRHQHDGRRRRQARDRDAPRLPGDDLLRRRAGPAERRAAGQL